MRRFAYESMILIVVLCVAGCAGSDEGASSPDSKESHPLVGNAAPAFSRPAVEGGASISIASLQGKVAIVDFWATWCEPCKKSFPKLEELNVKYRNSGLQIVGVSEDDDAGGIPMFAKELGTKFPLVWDQEKSIAAKWQPKSMPCTFVVDKNGIVRFVHFGFHDGEEVAIEQEVKSLL
jgi:peroxiredoxin